MSKTDGLPKALRRWSTLVACLVLSACAVQPEPEPDIVSGPEVAPQPVPEPQPPAPPKPAVVPEPTPVVPDIPAQVASHVAIVVSGSLPSYADVATGLVGYLENYDVYDLADRNRTPRQVFSAIGDSNAEVIVAVGLYAANVAKSFARVPVIFSQVFNVSDNELVSERMQGVSALPPMALKMDAWRALDPELQTVGAILGAGHDDLIEETRVAMERHGIQFVYAIAQSDRETLYHYKRMVWDIDGFILFPDNRILSRAALTEILEEAARHHVQVAVFNDSLLEHGAAFSTSAVAEDVVERIAFALSELETGSKPEPLAPLTEAQFRTNDELVRKFGLHAERLAPVESLADADAL